MSIYVIDVSGGDKIPRKGGPGITRSELLVINKIDLAPYVGASLEVMERDARLQRGKQPFVFTNLKDGTGLDTVIDSCTCDPHTLKQSTPTPIVVATRTHS